MLQILLKVYISREKKLLEGCPYNVFKDPSSMSMLVQHYKLHKEAKDYMMIFRDYDWMMVSNEVQRSQCKSKSKERTPQVITVYELKIKEKHSMLGLSFCNKV